MQNNRNILSFFILFVFILLSCSEAPKGDKAIVSEKSDVGLSDGDRYKVEPGESIVRFTGHGVGKNHPGNFKIKAGSLTSENKMITGGFIKIDIQSLMLEEKDEKIQSRLHPHLLSEDFFDAENYDVASFEITAVKSFQPTGIDSSVVSGANFMVSGNFTLKGVTKNISFPAKIEIAGNIITANANFDIDRNNWNMNYRSDKSLGNKFISEKVNIEISLKAIQS